MASQNRMEQLHIEIHAIHCKCGYGKPRTMAKPAVTAHIGRSGQFKFLSLPLELREAIYELLFEDNKHYPPKKLRLKVRNSRILRLAHELAPSSTLERPMPMEILRTCQQIYYEARTVLYRMRPVEICVGTWTRNMHFLDSIDVAPLINARKLLISIRGTKYAGPIQYAQKRKGSLGSMLARYADALIMSNITSGPNREIRLHFSNNPYEAIKPLADDEQQGGGWYLKVWYWAQVGEAVKNMREDLKKRAPSMHNLTLTSDIEGKIPKVKTSRYDASRVWYRNFKTKHEGFLGLAANGKVALVAAPPPKPKPESKIKPQPKSKRKTKPKTKAKIKTTK
ncbi:hypothetical protein E2P81_ATG08172 [Venturia nashicola]|nr:hypothetical protein E2P81_ATG08172 [Venturia nashicola]